MEVFDTFAFNFHPFIQKNAYKYKSKLGGATSIIIYALFQYWINGSMFPRVTQQIELLSEKEFTVEQEFPLVTLQVIVPSPMNLNVFGPKIVYLQAIAYYIDDITFQEPHLIEPVHHNTVEINQYQKQNIQLKKSHVNQRQLLIQIITCSPTYLQEGQQCANQEQMDVLKQLPFKMIFSKLNMLQFNPNTEQFDTFVRDSYAILDFQTSNFNQGLLKLEKYSIDQGLFLSQSPKEGEFLRDVELITQTVSLDAIRSMGQEAFYSLILRLDPVSTTHKISKIKFSEVVAQVVGISILFLQVFLCVRYLIQFYNEKQMHNKLIDKICEIYFNNPQRVIKTKIEKQSKQNQQKASINLIKQTALQKLNILQIINDILTMQLLIQEQQKTRINNIQSDQSLKQKYDIKSKEKNQIHPEDFMILQSELDNKIKSEKNSQSEIQNNKFNNHDKEKIEKFFNFSPQNEIIKFLQFQIDSPRNEQKNILQLSKQNDEIIPL